MSYQNGLLSVDGQTQQRRSERLVLFDVKLNGNICWYWIVAIFVDTGLWQYLLILDCGNICWYWIVAIFVDTGLWQYFSILDCDNICWYWIVAIFFDTGLWQYLLTLDCDSVCWYWIVILPNNIPYTINYFPPRKAYIFKMKNIPSTPKKIICILIPGRGGSNCIYCTKISS